MTRSIGIIGGMGPLATADLFQKIVTNTAAADDREHIHTYIDCNTEIPDRTEAILHGGESPLPQLIRSAGKLEQMGADLLALPCNTSHYFYDQLCAAVHVPVLHMLRITAQHLRDRGMDAVGVLATDGTIQTGIYHRTLAEYGIRTLEPEPEDQRYVMNLVYKGVKAGNAAFNLAPLDGVVDRLRMRGGQAVVLGCTELPMVFAGKRFACPHIDPTLLLAREAIRAAGGKLTPL